MSLSPGDPPGVNQGTGLRPVVPMGGRLINLIKLISLISLIRGQGSIQKV